MGRLSAFCIQAKLGSPMQDFHLQGGTCLMVDSIEKITFIISYPFTRQALREGPTKGAEWIDADCRMAAIQLKAPHVQMQYQPLRYHRTRLWEADPSPALWAAAVWPKRKAL